MSVNVFTTITHVPIAIVSTPGSVQPGNGAGHSCASVARITALAPTRALPA